MKVLGLKKDAKCREFDDETRKRFAFTYNVFETCGKLLKVRPMPGEGGHPFAPERMLEVLHNLDGRWSFEIWRIKDRINFYFWAESDSDANIIKSELSSHYPHADIAEVKVPTFPPSIPGTYFACAKLKMLADHCYPFETKFVDDPIKGLLMPLTYMKEHDVAMIQVVLRRAKESWASGAGQIVMEKNAGRCVGWINPTVVKATDYDKSQGNAVSEKANMSAFQVEIRIYVNAGTQAEAVSKAGEIAKHFTQYNLAGNNKFDHYLIKEEELECFAVNMARRTLDPPPLILGRNRYAITTKELANIIHLPRQEIDIPDIEWATIQQRMAPVVPRKITQPQNTQSVTICENHYRGRVQDVILTEEDLNTHLAVFGKTGTGKSTLIASMALEMINAGEGVVVIDPHGDLINEIVPRINEGRLNDVCYVDPMNFPLRLNAIEIPNRKDLTEKEILKMKDIVINDVVSIIRNIFYKDKPEYWGPRLDHVFSNVACGLLEKEGTTLVDMYFILTDDDARRKFMDGVADPIVKNFFENELPRRKFDDLDTTVTKVSKFAVNEILRKNLCQRYGTFNIKTALDKKKVLLFDLSKGNLGENNSKILGSAIVTQVWMSVLQRVKLPESDRVRTYMFVDEFQNFASDSFNSILSESRKYRLSLTLATQYTEQVSDEMWKGIEANVHTFTSFALGATDAGKMSKIYTDVEPDEFIQLEKFNIIMRKGQGTTQGRTRPLSDNKNNLNFKAVKNDAEERGFDDDSMISQYGNWQEDELNVINALGELKNNKKRDSFIGYEIEKELERLKCKPQGQMLDAILLDCASHGWVQRIWTGEAYEYRITNDGIGALDDLSGTSTTAGKPEHKKMNRRRFEYLTLRGNAYRIMRQGGASPVPDAIVTDGEYLKEVSGGRIINVEFETTTPTKPARILQNGVKSKNEDHYCEYIVTKEEDAEKIARILQTPYKVDKDGNYENYSIDSETEFIPEQAFSSLPTEKDFGILIEKPDGEYVRYIIKHEENNVEEIIKNKTKAVEDFLYNNGGAFRDQYIGECLGIDPNYVANILGRLRDKGVVEDVGWGLWAHCRWKLKKKEGSKT